MELTAFTPHDHGACIAETLAAAERHCTRERLQFTAVRRRVLEILLHEHKALGAYDILATLSAEGLGTQPPVAYRALNFLTRIGFVHKIENLNAYIACARPQDQHRPVFLICRDCGAVAEAEVPAETGALADAAAAGGFRIERTVVEATGLCPDCQISGPGRPPAAADRSPAT